METEQSLCPRRDRQPRDDVIIAHGEIVVRLVDPDHAAAGIVDEVVVKDCRPFGGGLAEAGDEIAAVLPHIEIEQIVIDPHSVADELDGVAGREIVVVNVEGSAAFWRRTSGVLRYRNGAITDVVVDLDVLVVLKRQFDGEVHLDGVVMNPRASELPPLDAVVPPRLAALRADETVVGDLRIHRPGPEDRSPGDAAIVAAHPAPFPTPAGIDELAVEYPGGLQSEGADAIRHEVLDAHPTDADFPIVETENRAVHLRPAQSEIGNRNARCLVGQSDQVGRLVESLQGRLRCGQRRGGGLPIGEVRDHRRVHAGALERHAGFRRQ